MKLIFKGVYKSNEQLPKGVLPKGAVKFAEPDNFAQLFWYSLLYTIPTSILIALFVFISHLIHGALVVNVSNIGFVLSLLAIIPHELLHAVCFEKSAEVELYISPKNFAVFVLSVQPVSKLRFIFLSMLPNLILAWIPLVIWVIMPYSNAISDLLLTYAAFSALMGVGDYMNVFNAIRQMPKGSMQQISGFNSYWFMPQ